MDSFNISIVSFHQEWWAGWGSWSHYLLTDHPGIKVAAWSFKLKLSCLDTSRQRILREEPVHGDRQCDKLCFLIGISMPINNKVHWSPSSAANVRLLCHMAPCCFWKQALSVRVGTTAEAPCWMLLWKGFGGRAGLSALWQGNRINIRVGVCSPRINAGSGTRKCLGSDSGCRNNSHYSLGQVTLSHTGKVSH